MNKTSYRLMTTLSSEKAKAICEALTYQFGVKAGFSNISKMGEQAEYQIGYSHNPTSYTPTDFKRWASGFLFGKFGE
jgi:hypothetical protein